MPLLKVYPETLVPTTEGSVHVPSMGTIDTHDQGFVDYVVGMGHGELVEPPPEADSSTVKKVK